MAAAALTLFASALAAWTGCGGLDGFDIGESAPADDSAGENDGSPLETGDTTGTEDSGDTAESEEIGSQWAGGLAFTDLGASIVQEEGVRAGGHDG